MTTTTTTTTTTEVTIQWQRQFDDVVYRSTRKYKDLFLISIFYPIWHWKMHSFLLFSSFLLCLITHMGISFLFLSFIINWKIYYISFVLLSIELIHNTHLSFIKYMYQSNKDTLKSISQCKWSLSICRFFQA